MRRLRSGVPDVLLIGALATLSALSIAGTALAPALLGRHPLLLVALAPRYPFLAVAAAHTPLGPFLLVAFVRLVAADGPNFMLARRHGGGLEAAASRWRVTSAVHAGLTRAVARFGAVAVACSPTGRTLALAGAAGLAPRRVAVADCLGTAVQVAAVWAAARRGQTAGLALLAIAVGAGAVIAIRAAGRVLSTHFEEASACVCW